MVSRGRGPEPDRSRRARRACCSVRAVLLLVLAWAAGPVSPVLAASNLAILPLSEVRPGMTGIGRTVFSGDSISTFPVTIVDVIPRARPQGNLILFRAGGELLEHSGIIAGMSGSPVYIDGRLVGAVAYAYPMLKDPIGGITPIEEMLAIQDLPRVPPPEQDGIEGGPVPAVAGVESEQEGLEAAPLGAPQGFEVAWRRFTRQSGTDASALGDPASWPWTRDGDTDQRSNAPEAMAVPVCLSGWESPVAADLASELRRLGYVTSTVSGGGESGGDAPTGGRLQPGSAVAVPYVDGDASMAAIGTVTAVEGDDVVAFGHPLLQGGPVSLPMCTARIHSVMPNLEVSFKLGSAGPAVGGVYQDRRAGIAGSMGAVPPMLPVRVTIHRQGEAPVSYRYRIVRDRLLTPFLLPWPVTNSWLHTGWAQGDASATCRTTVGFDHGRVVQRVETLKADVPPLQFGGAAILPAALLLTNPFERATLDSVGIDLTVERRNPTSYVTGIRCDRPRARVGETLRVTVTLEPWRGAREERVFSVLVRPEWAKRRLRISAGAASAFAEADRDRAPGKYQPRNLNQLVRLIETFPRENQLWLRVYGPGNGNLIDGQENSGLPPSIAVAGESSGSRAVIRSTGASLLQEMEQDTPWILDGSETTEVEVMP